MNQIQEKLRGIVERITYHNEENGWSVIKVRAFDNQNQLETVTVHQTRVFAGATMEFHGCWTLHPKFGRQFKASESFEKKPATAAALEKYLGSGLIKGVGPKTAGRIVGHFKGETLEIFEENIDRLTEVPGIAIKKLRMIETAWKEHRAVREVMMFLQSHGISTLFAVRIYKKYGDKAIAIVRENPYRLARDFYGIGFFSADKVALSIGFAEDSPGRIVAGINHVLAASREEGHCYLTSEQIRGQIRELLGFDLGNDLRQYLDTMAADRRLMVRTISGPDGREMACYYSKTLYFDELYVANRLKSLVRPSDSDPERISRWLAGFCEKEHIILSAEQLEAIQSITMNRFSVLTGGPGCGKTTTITVLVRLLEALHYTILLAAPTGRAAQRMTEVIGREAKTIHRLLEWQGNAFKRNEEFPLNADFLIIDECSMLDVSLTASLLRGVADPCGILFIGDADQLPSVGAGNVLADLLNSPAIPSFTLTKIFRQAAASLIIKYAHRLNQGRLPYIDSPFHQPAIWQNGTDCFFMDSDTVTKEQLTFIGRVKRYYDLQATALFDDADDTDSLFSFRTNEPFAPSYESEFVIPKKFRHVNISRLLTAPNQMAEFKTVLRQIHPWSSLHYGINAIEVIKRLYTQWLPKYYPDFREIQILSPMTRGSLGTANLNRVIQETINPTDPARPELVVGEKTFRVGDRVIHRRNNYDLNVFNGDIGVITSIHPLDLTLEVTMYPDSRLVRYQQDNILELDFAYAITVHKSQGSEFEVVILPILSQHFKMLFRNLIYTGLTRAKKLAIFVGSRQALSVAVKNEDTTARQTGLRELLKEGG